MSKHSKHLQVRLALAHIGYVVRDRTGRHIKQAESAHDRVEAFVAFQVQNRNNAVNGR